MTAGRFPSKLEGESLTYSINWRSTSSDSGPRLAENETIVTSVWDADAGIALSDDSVLGDVTIVRISGGTALSDYSIKNTVTTSDSNILVECWKLRIDDC